MGINDGLGQPPFTIGPGIGARIGQGGNDFINWLTQMLQSGSLGQGPQGAPPLMQSGLGGINPQSAYPNAPPGTPGMNGPPPPKSGGDGGQAFASPPGNYGGGFDSDGNPTRGPGQYQGGRGITPGQMAQLGQGQPAIPQPPAPQAPQRAIPQQASNPGGRPVGPNAPGGQPGIWPPPGPGPQRPAAPPQQVPNPGPGPQRPGTRPTPPVAQAGANPGGTGFYDPTGVSMNGFGQDPRLAASPAPNWLEALLGMDQAFGIQGAGAGMPARPNQFAQAPMFNPNRGGG